MSVPIDQLQCHPAVDRATCITVAEFRRLTQKRKWDEAWLTAQCQDALDNPRRTVRDILTKGKIPDTNMIPWSLLIKLYLEVTKVEDA